MLHVSYDAAGVTEPVQKQQSAVAFGPAVQSTAMAFTQEPGNSSNPSKAQVISFETGSDADVAVDATAGAWFRLYNASLDDDEPDLPAVEDLVAQLVGKSKPLQALCFSINPQCKATAIDQQLLLSIECQLAKQLACSESVFPASLSSVL
jgi:hypothetical protein